jgi:uncharacterized protein involved in exopolysaccharide biosynthesis
MSKTFILRTVLFACITGFLVYILTAPTIIPQRYTAEITFFVPLTVLEKQVEQDGVGFGSDAEIDAHIQMLQSSALQDVLTKKFSQTAFDLKVKRTRYGAVSLSITANDPELAATMANTAVAFCDSLKQRMMVRNRTQTYQFTKNLYYDKEQEVNEMQTVLDSLRELNRNRQRKDMTKTEDAFTFRIETLYGTAVNELAKYHSRLKRIEKVLEAPIPEAYVVSAAVPPQKASYPPRLLMALGAFVVALLLQFSLFYSIPRK